MYCKDFLIDPVPGNLWVIRDMVSECDIVRQPGRGDVRVREPSNDTLVPNERKREMRTIVRGNAHEQVERHGPGLEIGDPFLCRQCPRQNVYGWATNPIGRESQGEKGAAIVGACVSSMSGSGVNGVK